MRTQRVDAGKEARRPVRIHTWGRTQQAQRGGGSGQRARRWSARDV